LGGHRPHDDKTGQEIAQATGKNKQPEKDFLSAAGGPAIFPRNRPDNKFAFKPENQYNFLTAVLFAKLIFDSPGRTAYPY